MSDDGVALFSAIHPVGWLNRKQRKARDKEWRKLRKRKLAHIETVWIEINENDPGGIIKREGLRIRSRGKDAGDTIR